MEIKTLEGVDPKDILKAFNTAFSDYFVPFKFTKAQLLSKMKADKTALELSVGVFENQQLIAFVLHGVDIINNQKIVYNGGTGVIPQKRGSGLTKQMYHFILPLLEKKEIHKIVLEVITQNIQAITSYEKSGFKVLRELACFKGDVNVTKTNREIKITALQDYPWEIMKSFWDTHPTWQNSISVLNESKMVNHAIGAYHENQLVGYLIYNSHNNRLQQIAVDKSFRRNRIASSLMAALAKTQGNSCSAINVDKRTTHLFQFFESIELKAYLEQLEMELDLIKMRRYRYVISSCFWDKIVYA